MRVFAEKRSNVLQRYPLGFRIKRGDYLDATVSILPRKNRVF
jgi:hypothetical protein